DQKNLREKQDFKALGSTEKSRGHRKRQVLTFSVISVFQRQKKEPMPVRLMESLATTGPLADIFSDESVLQAMLDFEAALARVQARLKIIPEDAAKVISSSAEITGFDMSRLAHETLLAGTPAIP